MPADDKQPSGNDSPAEDNLSEQEGEGYSSDEYSGVVEEAEMAIIITPKKLASVLSAGDVARYVRRNKREAKKKGKEKEKDAEEPPALIPSGKITNDLERSTIAQRRKRSQQRSKSDRDEKDTTKKDGGSEKKVSS